MFSIDRCCNSGGLTIGYKAKCFTQKRLRTTYIRNAELEAIHAVYISLTLNGHYMDRGYLRRWQWIWQFIGSYRVNLGFAHHHMHIQISSRHRHVHPSNVPESHWNVLACLSWQSYSLFHKSLPELTFSSVTAIRPMKVPNSLVFLA